MARLRFAPWSGSPGVVETVSLEPRTLNVALVAQAQAATFAGTALDIEDVPSPVNLVLTAQAQAAAFVGVATVPDTTAPAVLGITALLSGDEIAIAYSETLDNFAPAAGQYTLGGTTATVASVAVQDNLIRLTLSGHVQSDETVTVTYVVPGSNYVRDLAGNAAAFSAHAVTNDSGYLIVAPSYIAHAIDTSITGAARTPDGSGFTLQAGDVLVAMCQNRSTSSTATMTPPAGQGWTEITQFTRVVSGSTEVWYWKRWGAGGGQTDDATPTFTWSTAGNVNSVALVQVRNASAASPPWSFTPVKVDHAASATLTAGTVSGSVGAKTLTLWGFHATDDNTLNANSRGTLVFSNNLSTVAAMALVRETGVNSGSLACAVTESTNGNDTARIMTLVLDGGVQQAEPTYSLTLLSSTGYGGYRTNATPFQQCSIVSDTTARSGYYWRYGAWYDRSPSPESRLWVFSQRRPAASDPLDPDAWETVTTQAVASGLNPTNSAADGHLSPSLGVDETGCLVVIWNAHWQEYQYNYWRGSAPGDIDVDSGSLASGLPEDISYPKLFRLSTGLCLTARLGAAGSGGGGTQGLWELNATTGAWTQVDDEMIVVSGGTPYMQHVHVNPSTDVVHFSFCVAENQYTAAYRDVYYFVASRSGSAGGAWTFRALAGGSTVALPIDGSATYRALATGLNCGLQVHQGLSSTADDVPLICVFYAKDGANDRSDGSNRYLITRSGGAWVRQLVHEVHPTWNLIDGNGSFTDPNATNNEYQQASAGAVLYRASDSSVHVVYRTNYTLGTSGVPAFMVTSSFASPYSTWSTPEILIDTPIGDSAPTHDTEAWASFGLATFLATLCDTASQWPGGAASNVYIADSLALPTA